MNETAKLQRRSPLAGLGARQAPALDPIFGIECPMSKWVPESRTYWDPSTSANDSARDANPSTAIDRIEWTSSYGSTTVGQGTGYPITPHGRPYELARLLIKSQRAAIVEKIATAIDSIDALDDDGFVLYSYGPQNGARTSLDGVLHPTPGVGRLTWQFALVGSNSGPFGADQSRLLGQIMPLGDYLIDPWTDLSNGTDLQWGDHMQRVVQQDSMIRLVVTLTGAVDRFRCRIGGRISGFTQHANQQGAALDSVRRRAT